jgi:hypothetical protein
VDDGPAMRALRPNAPSICAVLQTLWGEAVVSGR